MYFNFGAETSSVTRYSKRGNVSEETVRGIKNRIMETLASFDIGSRNFAFYIETTDTAALKALSGTIPDKKDRYHDDGTVTDAFGEVLQCVCSNGKTVLHVNHDLGGYDYPGVFHRMNAFLDSYAEFWDTCTHFVVEKQMDFGKFRNPKASRLGHHCQSYFMLKYPSAVVWSSYHKTQVLGCAKRPGKPTKTEKQDGKRSTSPPERNGAKATEILEARRGGCNERHNTKAKKDDLADTLTQLQAYKCLTFVYA